MFEESSQNSKGATAVAEDWQQQKQASWEQQQWRQEYVPCDNVAAMTFTSTPTDDGSDCKSVQISMTVAHGDVRRTVSAAAVIRRNLN